MPYLMSSSNEVIGIGPLSPPITGPGIKNRYIKKGLDGVTSGITWINTLSSRSDLAYEILRNSTGPNSYVISVSSNGRLVLSPLIAAKILTGNSRAVLLPAGGKFADELTNLPQPLKGFYMRLFSTFDAILPESDEEARKLDQLFGSDVVTRSLPNPRPRPDIAPDTGPSEENVGLNVVYVGRIKREKGIDGLIDSIRNVRSDDRRVSLDIYGHFLPGDSYQSDFKNNCDSTQGVEYKGKIPDGKVVEYLRDYDLFVLPTYYEGEGFPGVIIESFMAGLPVLATDWNYNGELVKHGYNGRLFEPKNTDDLTRNIRWFHDNRKELVKMRMNAWESSEEYSIESITEKLTTILSNTGWRLRDQ